MKTFAAYTAMLAVASVCIFVNVYMFCIATGVLRAKGL